MIGHLPVALVRLGAGPLLRRVDRELQVVRPDPVALGVRVGQGPALEHLVVREVDPVDEDARAEGRLLRLGEEVVRVAVEHHAADRQERELVLRPALGVVERVEVELRMVVVRHDLDAHLPLGEVAALDRVVEVLRGVADVAGLDLRRLVARQVLHALLRLERELAQDRLAPVVDELVGVDARSLHVAGSPPECPRGSSPRSPCGAIPDGA